MSRLIFALGRQEKKKAGEDLPNSVAHVIVFLTTAIRLPPILSSEVGGVVVGLVVVAMMQLWQIHVKLVESGNGGNGGLLPLVVFSTSSQQRTSRLPVRKICGQRRPAKSLLPVYRNPTNCKRFKKGKKKDKKSALYEHENVCYLKKRGKFINACSLGKKSKKGGVSEIGVEENLATRPADSFPGKVKSDKTHF